MQLKTAYVQTLKGIIQNYCPKSDIKLFGSRAKGTASKRSDIDLVIIDQGPIPLEKLTLINSDIADTSIPYMVDIVDWHRISSEFQMTIKSSAIPL